MRHDLVAQPEDVHRRLGRPRDRPDRRQRPGARRRDAVHAGMSARVAVAVAAALLASLVGAGPAGAAKTLVSYEQSGGIAGIRTSLSVTIGGSARVTSSRTLGDQALQADARASCAA